MTIPVLIFSKSIPTALVLNPFTSLLSMVSGGYVSSDQLSSPNPITDISPGQSIPISLSVFMRYKVILLPPARTAVGLYLRSALWMTSIQSSSPFSRVTSTIFASFVLMLYFSSAFKKPLVLSSFVVLSVLSRKNNTFLCPLDSR